MADETPAGSPSPVNNPPSVAEVDGSGGGIRSCAMGCALVFLPPALLISFSEAYSTYNRPGECEINYEFMSSEYYGRYDRPIYFSYEIVRHYGSEGKQKSRYKIDENPEITAVIRLLNVEERRHGRAEVKAHFMNCRLQVFPDVKLHDRTENG